MYSRFSSSRAYTTFMSYLHTDASSLRNEFECMTFIWIFLSQSASAEWSQNQSKKVTQQMIAIDIMYSLMWGAYCPSGTTTLATELFSDWHINCESQIVKLGYRHSAAMCWMLTVKQKHPCQAFKLGHVHHNALYLNCFFHHTQTFMNTALYAIHVMTEIVEIFIQQWSCLQSCHLWF